MKKILILTIPFLLFSLIATSQNRTVPNTYDSLQVFLRTQPKDTLYVWAMRPYTLKVIFEKADYSKADSLANEVKILSEKLSYGRGVYFHYLLKAIVHNQKSEHQAELSNYQKCLESVEKFKLSLYLQEASLSNIGLAYRNLGDKDKAMEYALKAIEIQEKNNFPIKFLDGGPYGLVATLLKGYKKPKEALKYAEKALEVGKKKQDNQAMGIQENRIGNIYDDMNLEKEALSHYLKGLEYARKANYLLLQTDLLSNVGRTYANLGQAKKGEVFLLENEKICRQLESPLALSTATKILGKFYFEQKDYLKAEKYFLEAYQINPKLSNLADKQGILDDLADFYSKTNNHKKAYSLMRELVALKDSSAERESEALSRDLLAKYETEKKETQIQLLNKEKKNADFQRNAVLMGGILALLVAGLAIFSISNRNKLKRFEEQQKLRNRIAADLHDEIGSTLSSISILSEMVAFQQQKGQFKPEVMQQVSDDARAVINKMDDIIWTINPENDSIQNLETRLKSFAIPLFESKDIDFRFDFSKEIDNIKIDLSKRRDIYLILKEAINNLIKYSQCKNVIIYSKIERKTLTMSIKDDGIGFDTNVESIRNGQRNMKTRAEKIGGSLAINSEIGLGTEVILRVNI
jgi:two-component system, NarL family, sensor histidine kinase UhpB